MDTRWIALVLTAVMLLTCAACGKGTADSSAPDPTLPPLPTSTATTTAAVSTPETTTTATPTAPQTTTTTTTTARQTVRITIPEGMTVTQIFKKLEEQGVCSFDALMQTAESYDYSYYPLIAARPGNTRAFRLEGYLYPDTYDFYKNEPPQDAIGRFLRAAEQRITAADRARAQAMGYSVDQILTVASIIEKEGSNPAQVSTVASVIYNRLAAKIPLQMDAGITYIESRVKPYISGDKNRYNSLYNMYKCSGLPAGPIGNPGKTTIQAALHPAETNYLYFCHDVHANYYFAATYEEHQENLKKAGLTA